MVGRAGIHTTEEYQNPSFDIYFFIIGAIIVDVETSDSAVCDEQATFLNVAQEGSSQERWVSLGSYVESKKRRQKF